MALATVTTWQVAFLAAGAPGLLLALLALIFPDPTRGSSEGVDLERLRLHEKVGAGPEDYTDLMVNSSYTYSLFGITFSWFALAGLIYWSKAFLTVAKGLPDAMVDSTLGISFLAAALLGYAGGGGARRMVVPPKCSGDFYRSRAGDARRYRVRARGRLHALDAVGRRRIVAGCGRDISEHRALLHDHLDRDDAQYARSRLRGCRGRRQSSRCHLVADSDGLDGRHVR